MVTGGKRWRGRLVFGVGRVSMGVRTRSGSRVWCVVANVDFAVARTGRGLGSLLLPMNRKKVGDRQPILFTAASISAAGMESFPERVNSFRFSHDRCWKDAFNIIHRSRVWALHLPPEKKYWANAVPAERGRGMTAALPGDYAKSLGSQSIALAFVQENWDGGFEIALGPAVGGGDVASGRA